MIPIATKTWGKTLFISLDDLLMALYDDRELIYRRYDRDALLVHDRLIERLRTLRDP